MADQKFVTVICTTPWGERHEFKAEASMNGVAVLFVTLPSTRDDIEFLGGWGNYGPVYRHDFKYELGPNWRQEIGHE